MEKPFYQFKNDLIKKEGFDRRDREYYYTKYGYYCIKIRLSKKGEGMKKCVFCFTSSDMIGLDNTKPHELYCPFCGKTQEEYDNFIVSSLNYNKSCLQCTNLKVIKTDGSLKVHCKMRKIKSKFFISLNEIGKNIIDEATYKIASVKCPTYDCEIMEEKIHV